MAPSEPPQPPPDARPEEGRRAAAAGARARLTQLVLVVGAVATCAATGAMAVNRLKNDSQSGTTTSTAAAASAPPARIVVPAPRSGPLTQRQESAALAQLAATGRPVWCGGGRKDMVALTFDDGPGPYTHDVARRLRRNGMRATFFVLGRNLPRYGRLVPEQLAQGIVGDHTMTHPHLAALGAGAQRTEIAGAQRAIARVTGRPVELFRPPYGQHSPGVDAIARANGLTQVLWSVDSTDSQGATAAEIKQRVISRLKPGAIILLHEDRRQTVRALPAILHAVRRRNLRAVSLPLLLTADPPTAAQLRRGRAGCGTAAGGTSGG